MADNLFLGIDGGGTGSRAVLGNDGKVLARAEGGPANPRSVGVEAAWKTLNELAAQALQEAKLPTEAIAELHVCLGLAGVGQEGDKRRFLAFGHPFAELWLETDVHVALVGALGREEGVLLAVGTGSIAYGVDAAGERYRAGGWGLEVGDEGSGAWLGREAVRLALRAHDGRGEETVLLARLLQRWGPTVDDLMERVRTAAPGDYGSLSPLVLEAAKEGDTVARGLMSQAVAELAHLLRALDRRLPAGALPFSITGGVGKLLLEDILEHAPIRFREGYRAPLAGPELGALELAKKRK
jgi:glucosamine kinase